jgi:Ca2+-binding EF-hand superfamily protein
MKRSVMMTVISAAALTFGLSAWAGEGHDGKHGGGAEWFKKADANGDGKLSKEEFAAVCKEGDAAKKFESADTDKDGFLTPDELKAAHGKGPHGGGQCPNGGKGGGDAKKGAA